MLRRFNGSVAFSDAPSGFFGFLRDTFAQLAREEDVAARRERADPPDYPSFGHAEDEYEDVVKRFYARWAGFSTRKSFAWRDRYRASEAEDRRMRRLVEKENRRFREEGIREFNDAVRATVAFVKKRDPRYEPNAQSEADRQKTLRDAAAAQAARSRAENLKKMEGEAVPQWARTQAPEDNEGQISDEESEEEQFECVACKKTFKSERQFEAHEKSKKHIKAVQSLRRQLQKEGASLDIDGQGDSDGFATPASAVEEASTVLDSLQIESGEEKDGSELDSNNATDNAITLSSEMNDDIAASSASSEADNSSRIALVAAMEKLDTRADYASPAHSDTDDTSNPLSTSTSPSLPTTASMSILISQSGFTSPPASPPLQPLPVKSQSGAAAQKRQKKAAAAAASAASSQHSAGTHVCVACSAAFPSKTRLFQHIKDFGHAAPVPGGGKAKGGKRR